MRTRCGMYIMRSNVHFISSPCMLTNTQSYSITVDTYSLQYNDLIMNTMASQITSLTIVYSCVYSGTDQRKRQSSASLAFVRGIHRWPVNSPHKGPVTRKMFPFHEIIMGHRGDITWTSTHWGWDKMAAIFHIFSNAFSWMKIYKFQLRFHWSLFPRVQ